MHTAKSYVYTGFGFKNQPVGYCGRGPLPSLPRGRQWQLVGKPGTVFTEEQLARFGLSDLEDHTSEDDGYRHGDDPGRMDGDRVAPKTERRSS